MYVSIIACLFLAGDKPESTKTRPGLGKSLREADRVVERAKLPSEAFLEAFDKPPSTYGKLPTIDQGTLDRAIKRKNEVIDGLKHSALMAEAHNHSITVTAVNDLDGGAAMVIGSWERDAKGMTFYNAQEREHVAAWERRLTEDEKKYQNAVEGWNRCMAERPDYCGYDPARDRQLNLDRLNAEREVDLRPTNEAANERVERYIRIRFELHCAPELAAKLDRVAILRKSHVPIVLQVEDVDLGLAAPDIPVPAVITLIRGQLIDVDRQSLLKVKDASTANPGE